MKTEELFLKTLFCCSACDGEIAPEEIECVKSLSENMDIFGGIDVECMLNSYIAEINAQGKLFLRNYLNEISEAELSDEDQVALINLAIKMIEADNIIQYSEVKFFKKIRSRLSITDNKILGSCPNSEEYLLPDISESSKDLEDLGNFAIISFSKLDLQ